MIKKLARWILRKEIHELEAFRVNILAVHVPDKDWQNRCFAAIDYEHAINIKRTLEKLSRYPEAISIHSWWGLHRKQGEMPR